jgi:hypothetical protein
VSELAFHDGHLEAIFAFVGIALAGVAGCGSLLLLMISCFCGISEHVRRIKMASFGWTVATGLSSIWILGEAIYRSVPQEDSVANTIGFIIITQIGETENPDDEHSKQLIITWIIAALYLVFYCYFSIVVISYVHILSTDARRSQSDTIAIKTGMVRDKGESPALSARSYTTDTGLLNRQFSNAQYYQVGVGHPMYGQINYGFEASISGSGSDIDTHNDQLYNHQKQQMLNPEILQQLQQYQMMAASQQIMLPPGFSEQVFEGENGEPISVVFGPNGQPVPPEIIQQIHFQHQQQLSQMGQEYAESMVTDMTYRSGAPLMANEQMSASGAHLQRNASSVSLSMAHAAQHANMMAQHQANQLHRTSSSASHAYQNSTMGMDPEVAMLAERMMASVDQRDQLQCASSPEELAATSSHSTSSQSSSQSLEQPREKKNVRFSLVTEEVEVCQYPAEK